ncbi:hypothetical protein [Rossellomorea arthrocnemi]|uniref:hypothetical protein n=1 Tax=Rossellomorea arthrocnemi TaxID=2769542 RepID=UPI0019195C7F|nr:hypothetical protein [Rossellomorea arthrocnemi]
MIKTYSMVVFVKETGDFKNATILSVSEELAKETFELLFGNNIMVIHTFEGEFPSKTYRSLPYIN